jgi:uncharacterized protein YecA (UPF0149 family)
MKTEVSKLNVRLPVELREDAAHVAAAMSQSLNGFIVQAVQSAVDYHGQRLYQRQRQMERAMAAVPDRASATVVVPQRSVSLASVPKVGANQPCPCGSGQKYKRCHGKP